MTKRITTADIHFSPLRIPYQGDHYIVIGNTGVKDDQNRIDSLICIKDGEPNYVHTFGLMSESPQSVTEAIPKSPKDWCTYLEDPERNLRPMRSYLMGFGWHAEWNAYGRCLPFERINELHPYKTTETYNPIREPNMECARRYDFVGTVLLDFIETLHLDVLNDQDRSLVKGESKLSLEFIEKLEWFYRVLMESTLVKYDGNVEYVEPYRVRKALTNMSQHYLTEACAMAIRHHLYHYIDRLDELVDDFVVECNYINRSIPDHL